MTSEGRTAHIDALDGLRGIAATIVLIGHTHVALTHPETRPLLRETPLAILMNGMGAVHLFFILSGFCLATSAGRASTPGELGQYVVRRIFRIHPPYMAALLLAWLASFAYGAPDANGGLSAWIQSFHGVHLSVPDLLRYLTYPSAAGRQLPAAWSMAVEMLFSLVLPAMIWLSRRTHWSLLLALLAWPMASTGFQPGILRFGFFFAAGIALYEERDRLSRWFARRSVAVHALLVVLGLVMFGVPGAYVLYFRTEGIVLSTLGCILLVACAMFVPAAARVLSSRALVHHGRISYSFYLLHFTVLLLCTKLVNGPVGPGQAALVLGLSFALTTLGADLAWRAIERPSIRLGNALCRRIAAATGDPAQVSRLVS